MYLIFYFILFSTIMSLKLEMEEDSKLDRRRKLIIATIGTTLILHNSGTQIFFFQNKCYPKKRLK